MLDTKIIGVRNQEFNLHVLLPGQYTVESL